MAGLDIAREPVACWKMVDRLDGATGVGRRAALQIISSSKPGTKNALSGRHQPDNVKGGEKSSRGCMNSVAMDPVPAATVVVTVMPIMGRHPCIPTGRVVRDDSKRCDIILVMVLIFDLCMMLCKMITHNIRKSTT